MENTRKVKVLIVDDSAMIRKILSEGLAEHKNIEVVGTAGDPFIARDKIISLKPDVLTLDVEMPRMDGITFLKKLAKYYPLPVIILSSLTEKGGSLAMEALASGAVDVFCKPQVNSGVKQLCSELAERIIVAAGANVKNCCVREEITERKNVAEKQYLEKTTLKVIAIGSSTGGVQAIQAVLEKMPVDSPGIVIVQHMPANFTASFAQRLNSLFGLNVKEAQTGDRVLSGRVLIAPGGKHMVLQRSGADYSVALKDGPLVCHQKPSVDVLFESVAKYAGPNAVGAILTGMGNDGAAGLLKMRQNGAHTVAQDEKSCVVFGMPKEAIKVGAAEQIASLSDIPSEILKLAGYQSSLQVQTA
jgi:two-component system chemotaxis response regulator CheB